MEVPKVDERASTQDKARSHPPMGRGALLQQGALLRSSRLPRRQGPLLRSQGQGQRGGALLLRDARDPKGSSRRTDGLVGVARGPNFRELPFSVIRLDEG